MINNPLTSTALTAGSALFILSENFERLHMKPDRRNFLASACTGLCVCGLSSAAAEPSAKTPMPSKWIAAFLPQLEARLDADTARTVLKAAAVAHYDELEMDKQMQAFKGRLDPFLDHIGKEWGWKIAYDKQAGVIRIDENKDYCVCPLKKDVADLKSSYLCYCSEGFNERMFAVAAGRPVQAEVTQSVLRGAKSCCYTITLA
jgi:hypothetical protein